MSNKINILVCDADPYVLKFFKELDAKMNMDVHCVDNCQEAIEVLKKQEWFCIFIDSKLAVGAKYKELKDSLEPKYLREIKSVNPNLPMFIMVESAADPFLETCLNEGAMGAFYKPPEMDKVTSAIQALEAQRFFRGELERTLGHLSQSPESSEAEEKVGKISDLIRKAEEVEQKRKKHGG